MPATFIPTPSEQEEVVVGNIPFFPDISLNALRASVRIDQVIENGQLQHIVEQALIVINDKLAAWVDEQILAGVESLASIPSTGYAVSREVRLYLQAVYQQAKYDLLENYRDYDSSHQGHENADNMQGRLDHCLIQIDDAVTALKGKKPTRVVLI